MDNYERATPQEIAELIVYAASAAFIARAEAAALRMTVKAAGVALDDAYYKAALEKAFYDEARQLTDEPDTMGELAKQAMRKAVEDARRRLELSDRQ